MLTTHLILPTEIPQKLHSLPVLELQTEFIEVLDVAWLKNGPKFECPVLSPPSAY